jgi:hypothetical protein
MAEKSKSEIKARRSFEYQLKKASRCRHDKYQVSCNSCPEREECEIQSSVYNARKKLYGS